MSEESSLYAKEGDLAQLVSPTNKTFIVRLTAGGQLHTHRGILSFDELIGKSWGCEVKTHLGKTYYLFPPSLRDLLQETRRSTQIMYPKDIGFVLVTMGIGPGSKVVEAGTGSGAMTTALAWAVGHQGHVTTYESRLEMQNLAIKNLEALGMSDRVTFKLRDISEGFDERGMEALFMDIPNAFDYLPQVRQALRPGGYFGCILPTANQVSSMLVSFHRNAFEFVEVCEIILRYFKPAPERLRPTDRMVAHTGYLLFSRPVQFNLSTEDEKKCSVEDPSTAEA